MRTKAGILFCNALMNASAFAQSFVVLCATPNVNTAAELRNEGIYCNEIGAEFIGHHTEAIEANNLIDIDKTCAKISQQPSYARIKFNSFYFLDHTQKINLVHCNQETPIIYNLGLQVFRPAHQSRIDAIKNYLQGLHRLVRS